MYNEKQKKEYLESIKDRNRLVVKWLNHVFEETEILERKLSKDVAAWTSPEILTHYKLLATSSINSLMIRHNQLQNYAQWCYENILLDDHINHYNEIDLALLKSCINVVLHDEGIMTRAEMEKKISNLLNPRDRCLVYAIFEGIQGKQFSELVSLNINQVEGNKIHLATRTIEVSNKFINLLHETSEEYTYFSYGKKQKIMHYHEEDTNVFKMTPNSRKTSALRKRQRLYTNLTRIKEYLDDPAITTTSLTESGRIDMIKRFMKIKPDLDVEEIIREYKSEIQNKYGIMYNMRKYMLVYGDYYNK